MRRLSRQAWIEGALRMLDAGPEGGLSIERLARQLGVTRGSFYHHFSARKALVVALLERWEDTHTRQVIRQASEVADGPQRLRAWVEAVAALPKGREVALRRWAAGPIATARCEQAWSASSASAAASFAR